MDAATPEERKEDKAVAVLARDDVAVEEFNVLVPDANRTLPKRCP
jgi:hypothetical protein